MSLCPEPPRCDGHASESCKPKAGKPIKTDNGAKAEPRTVAELAAAKQLPEEFLRGEDIDDIPGGGIEVPYYDEGRRRLLTRRRGVPGEPRFQQPARRKLEPYGVSRLADMGEDGNLYVCEGETDALTCWYHGLPALGIPGADAIGCLRLDHLNGVKRLFVLPDNDPAGSRFVEGLAGLLGRIGYAGEARAVKLPDGVKDVNALHCSDPKAFRATLAGLRAQASPLRIEGAAKPPEKPRNADVPAPPAASRFPLPIPASQLKAADQSSTGIWRGVLYRGEVTLLTALWKAGKTTLLAHMLKAMEAGGVFLGQDIVRAKALFVTEESEARWAERRDAHGLTDAVEFLVRPLKGKATHEEWEALLAHVKERIDERGYDVVVFDTLPSLWPVKDENDASAVQAALMPLHSIIGRVALLLVHHNRKSDGTEATASRGSGALTGFVDTIVEFRRCNPQDRKDRRRVLSGYGRHDETPPELVIELKQEGYVALGDRQEVQNADLDKAILNSDLLPASRPGKSAEEIHGAWPDGPAKPGIRRLKAALAEGAEKGAWQVAGKGVRGNPFLYWRPPETVF